MKGEKTHEKKKKGTILHDERGNPVKSMQEIKYKGTCPRCSGPLEPKLYVMGRNADGTVQKLLCFACGGTGEVFEKEGLLVCSDCGGTGYVDNSLIEPYCPTCKGFWRWTVNLENEEPGIQPDEEDFPGILEAE